MKLTRDQRVIETLKAADHPLTAEELRTLTGMADVSATLTRLKNKGLVQKQPSDRNFFGPGRRCPNVWSLK